MKIIIKEPNKKPVLKDVEDSFEFLASTFKTFDTYQGYSYTNGFDIYVEDMQTEDIKFNFYTKTQPIYGTAIFIGYDGNEDNIGLNKSQINYIKKNFK